MNETHRAYDALLKQDELERQRLQRLLNTAVTLRLLLFGGLAFAVYASFAWSSLIWVASFILLGAFLVVVRWNQRKKEERDHVKARLVAAANEVNALNGDFSAFEAGTSESSEHPFAADLDLFGRAGVHPMLSRAQTVMGRQAVRKQLLDAPVAPERMSAWHEALSECASAHEWRIDVVAAASKAEADPHLLKSAVSWSKGERTLSVSWRPMLWAVPVYAALVIGAYAFSLIPFILLVAAFFVPIGMAVSQLSKTKQVYEAVGRQSAVFTAYANVIEAALNHAPKAERNAVLFDKLDAARKAFRDLSKVLSAFDQRNNFLVAIVANALYLAEVRNALAAEDWRAEHGEHFEDWLSAIGELELLLSLSTFTANTAGQHCWPQPLTEVGVEAEGLVHPLLAVKRAVANDLHLSAPRKTMIVTGANMAGKSTYLRTIGVSVLLARMGAPVLAKRFALSDVRMFSSMRTADSLDSGTSYFMAELRRLSELMESAEQEPPVLALLDEILKGTNSVDKEKGSRAFVERLLERNCVALIATHDVSLCTLEEAHPEQVVNKHFASELGVTDLTFDYQLKDGVCDTMNATFLMQKMGILKDTDQG
jgi:hypothetical protein